MKAYYFILTVFFLGDTWGHYHRDHSPRDWNRPQRQESSSYLDNPNGDFSGLFAKLSEYLGGSHTSSTSSNTPSQHIPPLSIHNSSDPNCSVVGNQDRARPLWNHGYTIALAGIGAQVFTNIFSAVSENRRAKFELRAIQDRNQTDFDIAELEYKAVQQKYDTERYVAKELLGTQKHAINQCASLTSSYMRYYQQIGGPPIIPSQMQSMLGECGQSIRYDSSFYSALKAGGNSYTGRGSNFYGSRNTSSGGQNHSSGHALRFGQTDRRNNTGHRGGTTKGRRYFMFE